MLPSLPRLSSSLPPVVWTYLPSHLPYSRGLLLQESLVQARLSAKHALQQQQQQSASSSPLSPSKLASLKRVAETDILLLLQHTPVYTAGRREAKGDAAVMEQQRKEEERLKGLGADWVQTMRGGQTTYHGPGQLVGYSLMDLGAAKLSTRCYVDHLERFLASLTRSLHIPVHPLEHTGVFTSPSTKIGSIGIHIRRRISLHGFSFNVEEQTKGWFDQIVACGLADVRSTNATAELRKQGFLGEGEEKLVKDVVPTAVELFKKQYGREMRMLEEGDEFGEVRRMIEEGVEGRLPPLEKVLLGV